MNINKLKGRITEKGYTIGRFGEEIGLGKNTITSRLSGRTSFTLSEVDKICDILEISSNKEKCDIFLG